MSAHMPAAWWLTIPEVCALLKVSEADWRQMREQGQTPPHHPGPDGAPRVHRADLDTWLEHQLDIADSPLLARTEVRTPQRHQAAAAELPAGRWLTIPQICAALRIDPAEWQQWRTEGQTPLHVIGSDGTPRVRRADFDAWINSLPTD